MEKGEFIQKLKTWRIPYSVEGDVIVVEDLSRIDIYSIAELPPNVVFLNRGDIRLLFLKSISSNTVFQNLGFVYFPDVKSVSPGTEFKNSSYVSLPSLQTLPPGVEFQNKWDVYLDSLQSLPPDVVFQNKGDVWLESLIGGWFEDWSGNIKGVRPTDLLNHLIKKGAFV
jgi:hypothetical protein